MRRREPVRGSESALFEPWERLLLVSIELDRVEALEHVEPTVLREVLSACFAVVKQIAGRLTREDAYGAVARAMASVKNAADARGVSSERDGLRPAAPAAVQHRLDVEGRREIRLSPEAHEAVVEYARERGLDLEAAADRLLRTAVRRRRSVNAWNRAKAQGGST